MKPLFSSKKTKPNVEGGSRRIFAEELESRVLYSAAPVEIVDDIGTQVAQELVVDQSFESVEAFANQSHIVRPVAEYEAIGQTEVVLTNFANLTAAEVSQLETEQALSNLAPAQVTAILESPVFATDFEATIDPASSLLSDPNYQLPTTFAIEISEANYAQSWDSLDTIVPAVVEKSTPIFSSQLTNDFDGVTDETAHLLMELDATGKQSIQVSFQVSSDSTYSVAVQYRVGGFGSFQNLQADDFQANGNHITANLPSHTAGQSDIEFRILNLDDTAYFGIENLRITSQ